jgi:SAM-dependent methyltransferase
MPKQKPSPPGRGQGEGRARGRNSGPKTFTPALSRRERGQAPPLAQADLLARFDEPAYLAAYPDVAAAVAAGALASGSDHFTRFGLAEGRNPCPVDRRARLLEGLTPARLRGVEIGPLNRPTVRKDEGEIVYVDHTDRAGLLEIFASTDIDPVSILEVDAIWGDKRLIECLPGPVDYVIASHVIEHVPDLLGWLCEVREVLTPTGQLRLAVPDRRYTFDILRGESALADVLDAYLRRARAPLPRAVIEFLLMTREVSAQKAWLDEIDLEALRAEMPSIDHALTLAGEVLAGRYVDSHCWIFTPRSFAGLMEHLSRAGLLGLACASFHDTAPFDLEFFVALRPEHDAAKAAATWRKMTTAVA